METYLLILNEGGIFIWALLGLALVGLLFILRTIIRRLRKTAPFLPDEPIYRTLIEQTLMGVAIVQNGQIVFTNPAVAQITGYTTDDFRAISVEEALANMIHQEDMPHLRQMMENVLTGKPVIPRAEYRFIRKDGSITWFMAEVSRIEYQRQPALQFVILDTTSVKKTAKELQISQALLSQAEEIAKSGTFDWDLTTNSAIWSPGMHQLFEIPPEQFNHDPGAILKVLHPDDVNYIAQALQEVIQDKQMRSHLEYRIVLPSGMVRHIWAQGILLFDEMGNAVRMIGVCSDITIRKQAEEALRESEERFRQLAENIDEIFWITTATKDQMLYISPAYERVWGHTCASLYASPRGWLEAVHPEDQARVAHEALTRQIEGTYHEEYRIIRPDGTIRWIRDRAFPISVGSGQVNHIVGIAQDITEYKQAEMIQRNYVSFLETMKSIDHIILGAQNVRHMLNDVLEKMLVVFRCDRVWLFFPCDPDSPTWMIPMEKTRSEYPGAGILEIGLPMNDGVKFMMQDHLNTKGIVIYELDTLKEIFGDSAEERHQTQSQMSLTLYPRVGQPWLLGIHQCTHNRHWTEEEKNLFREIGGRISDSLSSLLLLDTLTQSEARYRAIVEDQTELICRSTPDHLLTFVNDAYCRFFGYPRQQLIGQSFTPLVPPEFHSLMHQKRTSLTPERPVTSDEFLESNAEGLQRWLYWTERAIFDEAGHLIEIQSVGRDVTQRKQAEEEIRNLNEQLEQRVLERTAQLQAVNQELESFSYSISHDLRAPLRAINGFASLIKSNHLTDLNEEGQTYLNKIIQASSRMGYLIDDLLKYARLGRSSLRRAPVALNDLLEEVVFDMQVYIEEAQGTIHIAPEIPIVLGDRTLLHQVFTNLLENALKYRQANVPPHLVITAQSEKDKVIILVKDNGIGIPAEYQEKIFKVFQRLHREDEYPGTGIGLATVKKAVELMGGEIRVESVVGEGSTFFVKLPRGEKSYMK